MRVRGVGDQHEGDGESSGQSLDVQAGQEPRVRAWRRLDGSLRRKALCVLF